MLCECAVVPHIDDLGASHGAHRAFLELAARGFMTCGSVMVPGPWFREIAEAASADPALDLGVYLTLTREWSACRWAPISTVSRASGLIDPDGLALLDQAGAPVFDHCRGTLAVDREHLEEGWRKLVVELAPGVTHLALGTVNLAVGWLARYG